MNKHFTEVEVIEHLVKAYKKGGSLLTLMKIYIEDVIIVYQVLEKTYWVLI